eukprot:scaffold108898_cov18-Tisochrysis_lutea.AAC.1
MHTPAQESKFEKAKHYTLCAPPPLQTPNSHNKRMRARAAHSKTLHIKGMPLFARISRLEHEKCTAAKYPIPIDCLEATKVGCVHAFFCDFLKHDMGACNHDIPEGATCMQALNPWKLPCVSYLCGKNVMYV